MSKFFGMRVFGEGKSSFFEVIGHYGFFIFSISSAEKGAIEYFVEYHSSTSEV
jgi:hypothetical protein